MKLYLTLLIPAVLCLLALTRPSAAQDGPAVALPPGVKAVWDLAKAARETTPTRERICINGLWRWQPAAAGADTPPAANWGYFKVPGAWPGITDYMEKDCQTLFVNPAWKSQNLANVTSAWYEREITIPAKWTGRDITLSARYLNSYAEVYVDGKKAGEMRFPAGEVDLTNFCRPGSTHRLSILVAALPMKGVRLSFTDTNSAREVKGSVARRGLCGDVFLTGKPKGARIDDVKVDTSVRRWEITLTAELPGLAPNAMYSLRARVTENGRAVKEFTSKPFSAADLKEGRFAFTAPWKPNRLWDTDTPGNRYDVSVSLRDSTGAVVDTGFPKRFGFREFWIVGRDFYLNGIRIHLSAVPLDNAQVGAAWASYAGAMESMKRLKSLGINFVYTHNYDCEPGSHLSFDEILKAADDSGMLVALTQPHFSSYDWTTPDADSANGYAHDAAFYVRVAEDHPSVVAYAMSHNATGYNEDTNPDRIDGLSAARDSWALNNVKKALRAEAIVHHLDPSRIIYHHSSGNLSAMYTVNFYTNFAPIQELDDWFEHWATQGVKPLFLVEYGCPFSWDWTMYRGWYNGVRTFGSARVPWEFCLAEWDSQFLGDRAFNTTPMEKANIRWEAKQFRAGNLWYRWDYPYQVGSPVFDDQQTVFAEYITDNWRSYRTWGVSGISPWEYAGFWKLRPGVDQSRKNLPVDWDNLQRPGFSPDYIDQRYGNLITDYDFSDWIPTAAGKAVLSNNQPLLAYIAGKPARFTSKDHNFLPGETVEKQIIVINNSRRPVTCDCEWSVALPHPVRGSHQASVPPGQQARIPLRFELAAGTPAGQYTLSAMIRFSTGETHRDSFALNVLATAPALKIKGKTALFDPPGETASLLAHLGVPFKRVDAGADLSAYGTLIIGKGALTAGGPGPDLSRVRAGLKVIVFEQTSDALEKRLGFRVEEYGLRQVFPRVSGHPALAGLSTDALRDWRGAATIMAPRLQYTLNPKFNGAPTVKWCGMDVPRVWRCGNQGNVASVLIEKPARGDFLPLIDGSYSLQYSPLLEYHEGKGMILFCQLDVTGRTESDPAAMRLTRNILQYVSGWKPALVRQAIYAGDAAGESYLHAAGVAIHPYDGAALAAGQVLIVGPGGASKLAGRESVIRAGLNAGGRVLTIGLDQAAVNAFLPAPVTMKKEEHISAFFQPFPAGSPFAGVGPADVQDRDPRETPLVTGGAEVVGDGVLARGEGSRVVFCQLVPWQFDSQKPENQKRTFRRTSVLLARLLSNMGIAGSTPLLDRFSKPATAAEKRWLTGLYLDQPIDWDDPYRFFGW
ncbi:MAG TPA: hypothetical protein VFJ58_22070 [Armatimonadota bacterium]|nr:hypothetical protein [Armatimonadota bacterium]